MSRLQRSWAAIKREACNLGLNRRGRKDHLKLDNLTDWEKGYLGGIIDGEGCITIERMKKGCLLPRITIKNTGRDLLKFVQDITGGTVNYPSLTEGACNYSRPQLFFRTFGFIEHYLGAG